LLSCHFPLLTTVDRKLTGINSQADI